MTFTSIASKGGHYLRIGLAGLAMFQFSIGAPLANAASQPQQSRDSETTSPIKHVIVIIGENRSFDHVFATYVPKPGEFVWNLLSEGIVNSDGTPGPNFSQYQQFNALDQKPDVFLLSPPRETSAPNFPNRVLPAPLIGGPNKHLSYIPSNSLATAQASENGLPSDYYQYLIEGGTTMPNKIPDTRITNVNSLPPGPFQLTNGSTFTYHNYAASPVHRFYQMWQQLDCSLDHATYRNPSGCDALLFPWVEVTVGGGTNGGAQASNFSIEYSPTATTTGEGSTSMGFYNIQNGDVPYFKSLADKYAMSDNFHQSVNGGTGANHIMLGHGDAIWFSDGKGHPAVPPNGKKVFTAPYNGGPNPDAGVVDEIENPNPASGTNNWYTEDGYGNSDNAGYPPPYTAEPVSGGGSYSDCSDPSQPGVGPVVTYLNSIGIDPHCQKGHYYLLNNYNPGWFGNGKNAYTDQNPANTPFTIPPSSTPSVGDSLHAAGISWKYYGDQWNNYVPDPYQLNYGAMGANTDEYCNICNPFQYDTSIMADANLRTAHIQDTANLYADIKDGNLPAVSFVKPSGLVDGHPASSKLELFEGFSKKIVDLVQNNPTLWKDTAILITFDEGGGYYDSGYVQPLDFFGDGTRIPLIVVSPYARSGHISHSYSDHVSILKFIDRNWGLEPVSHRSRDNFSNPIAEPDNPYVPVNSPALDDLFDLFNFSK
ncbi:MAG: alkaline phosphatase family protein [Candidatus Sulfotelmatobacter sp.]